MDELFKAIRQSCSPLTWSRGVELSRQNLVVGEQLTDTEIILRVGSPDSAVSRTVKLWPEEEDWLCDCGSPNTPCEHIAAAIIALRRAREQGKQLPVSSVTRGIVVYRFKRASGALALERRIKTGDNETVLTGPLSRPGTPVNASKEDLAIDSLLSRQNDPVLPANLVTEVLKRLSDSEQVALEGEKISVGKALPARRVVVTDVDNGVRVGAERPPEIAESFSNGAFRIGNTLHPVRTPDLTAPEVEMLSRGRVFGQHEYADLASRILPNLEKKLPIEIRTQRLPRARTGADSRPRLVFQTQATGDVLSVLPIIVYGDPPYARVDGGRLTLLGGNASMPERNLLAETRLTNELRNEFGFAPGKRIEFRGDAATKFAERLRGSSAAVAGNGLTYFGAKTALRPEVFVDEDGMRVTFRLPGGASADAGKVFGAWREGLGRVALDDGSGWAPIPSEWLEQYGQRVLDLLAARDREGKLPAHARPEMARLCEQLDTPCPPSFKRLRERLESFRGIPEAALPKDLTATLRTYQRLGVDWLSFLQSSGLGALLADDMGLGKTLQTMSIFQGRVLVVAPTSVLPNWQRELARFRPGLNVNVYHGGDRKLGAGADITLTTYAILRLDIDFLSEPEWDTVVLDEAQAIKNPESQVAQAAFRLRSKFRAALTGTPIENRLEDLWSLFHFLNRGLLGGRADFEKRYSHPAAAADLRARIKPFVLRRLKREVAPELPPRTDLVLYCELDAKERETYDVVRAAARKEVLEQLAEDGGPRNVLAALEALLRLRQAATHRALLPNQSASDSSKTRVLLEKLEEAVGEGHKALVFSQWTSLLDLLEPHLDRAGIRHCRIDGSTRDRAGVVESFQSAEGPPVLLMTLKAGGVGLNLTAADHVFLVDPWWNPAAEDQAADRAHRIGQDRPVFVHRLVAKETVEEKILALQESKRATATAALEGAQAAVGITRDELLGLLN